jgi:hypothetical protein
VGQHGVFGVGKHKAESRVHRLYNMYTLKEEEKKMLSMHAHREEEEGGGRW